MKSLLFCIFLSFGATAIKAQALQDSIPVIISLTDDTQQNIKNVKAKFTGLSNINYVGFCNNHKVFLVYVDPAFHGSPVVFLASLIKTTGIYELSLKEGTIKDIVGFCDFTDPAEYEKNKLLQAK